MTTGNTTLSAGSSTQTMLLSATPMGIKLLAELSEHPEIFPFSGPELDDMLEDEDTEVLEGSISDGCYIPSFLSAIEWWIDVSKAIAIGRGELLPDLYNPEFKEHRAKLIFLLNDTLSSYAAALAEQAEFSDESWSWAPASIELLKRYRRYTQYVCSFAQEMWPSVNFGWLLDRA